MCLVAIPSERASARWVDGRKRVGNGGDDTRNPAKTIPAPVLRAVACGRGPVSVCGCGRLLGAAAKGRQGRAGPHVDWTRIRHHTRGNRVASAPPLSTCNDVIGSLAQIDSASLAPLAN